MALMLILGVVGLVTALYFASGGFKVTKAQPEEEVQEVDPFADLPPEKPRERQVRKPH